MEMLAKLKDDKINILQEKINKASNSQKFGNLL